MDEMVGRVVAAANHILSQIANVQDSFSNLLYPALGLTADTLQYQRMVFFKNLQSNDFKQFVKDKAAKDVPLSEGNNKPVMHYLLRDMSNICQEFTDFMAKKPKDHEIFMKKASILKTDPPGGKPNKPSGSGGGGSKVKRDRSAQDKSRGSGDGRSGGGSSFRNNNNNKGGGKGDAGKRHRGRSLSESPSRSTKRSRDDSRSRSRDRRPPGGGQGADRGKDSGAGKKRKDGKGKKGKVKSFPFSFPLSQCLSGPTEVYASFFPVRLGFDAGRLEAIASFSEGGRTHNVSNPRCLVTNSERVFRPICSEITWNWKVSPPSRFPSTR